LTITPLWFITITIPWLVAVKIFIYPKPLYFAELAPLKPCSTYTGAYPISYAVLLSLS